MKQQQHNRPMCAVYVRVSMLKLHERRRAETATTEDEVEDGVLSLQAQERACREHAESLGYATDDSFVFKEIRSGGDFWQREELQRLLSAVRAGTVQALCCWKSDRLTRDPLHLGYLLTELERHRAALVFATESFDLNNPVSELMMNIQGFISRTERVKISERTRMALLEKIQQGQVPAQGTPAYGYLKGDGSLIIYEPEAAVVRRIFSLVLDGFSLAAVAARLNAEGVPPPSAGPKRYTRNASTPPVWWTSTLRGIVTSPVYRGELELRRRRSVRTERGHRGGKSRMVSCPPSEWLSVRVPSVVSDETWFAAQGALCQRNTRAARSRNAGRFFLLRGLAQCAVCGQTLSPLWKHDAPNYYYRCVSRMTPSGDCGCGMVRGDRLDEWVWESVSLYLQQPALIAEQVERHRSAEPDPDVLLELETARVAFASAERRQQRLLGLFAGAEDDMPLELVRRQLAEAEREKARHSERIEALETRLREQRTATARLLSVVDYCEGIAARLGTFSLEEKRTALEALGIRVVAAVPKRGQSLEVEWRLEAALPVAGGNPNTQGALHVQNATITVPLARRAA